MLKFVRSGRKETTYSAGLHPVIKAGLRAGKGKHTVFVPFRLESINTQHNIGVLVSGDGYSHQIIVTDPTREGKKFKITSNIDKYNIYIDGQKYDGRELDFGQIYTLSFSAELGKLVHLGASKLVTADFYQGIKVFSEQELLGSAIESEHTEWAKKYGEEKTKTLAAIEAAKLVPAQPTPGPTTPSAPTPDPEKNIEPGTLTRKYEDMGREEREERFFVFKLSEASFDENVEEFGSLNVGKEAVGKLRMRAVPSVPPVAGYKLFKRDPLAEGDSSGTEPPKDDGAPNGPPPPPPPEEVPRDDQKPGDQTGESEGNKPAETEPNPPANNETEKREKDARGLEVEGIYTFSFENSEEDMVESDGNSLTITAVSTSTPVAGYKLLVKESS